MIDLPPDQAPARLSPLKFRRPFFVILIYLLLSIVMTWPVAAHLGSYIPGDIGDSYVHLWLFNWLKQAIVSGQNPFFTEQIFYPVGVSLWNHNIAWVNFAAWLSMQWLVGSAVAYSLMFMATYAFNGYAMYLLAKALTKSETAAFIAGLIAGFWPYNLSHPDHPNLILIGWVPLALLALHRVLAQQRRRDALLFGVFVALIGLTRWQLLIISAPLLLLFLLRGFWASRHQGTKLFKLLVLSGVITAVLTTPLLLPLLNYQFSRTDIHDVLVAEETYGTDLAAYITPNRYHPLWGDSLIERYRAFAGNTFYVRFMGFAVLILVLMALWRRWHKARFWLLAALVYVMLALGSELVVNGHPLIPLPYALVDDWFIIRSLRFPDRFNVLLAVPVAMLAGWGMAAWANGRSLRYKTSLTALISLLILGEYLTVFPLLPVAAPAWYTQLETADYAIADLPTLTDEFYNKQYMAYQLTHGQPLVTGRVARPPQQTLAFLNSVPLLQQAQTSNDPPPDLGNVSAQLRLLAEANVRYLVLHKQFLSQPQIIAWHNWFVAQPTYEDEALFVYRTDTPLAVARTQTMTAEISLISARVLADTAVQGDWIAIETNWVAETAVSHPYQLCFSLNDTTWDCVPLLKEPWQAGDVVRANYPLQISPFADGGTFTVQMGLSVGGAVVGETAVLTPLTITPLARVFTPPPAIQTSTLQWQNGLQLLSYASQLHDGSLDLNLVWQTDQRLDESYKLFVHLINPATNDLIGQTDLIPRNWTYPTDWWEAGEVVTDTVTLTNVPAGEYELWLGWYEPESGARLLLVDGQDRGMVTAVTP